MGRVSAPLLLGVHFSRKGKGMVGGGPPLPALNGVRERKSRPCRSLLVDAVNLEVWKQGARRDLLEKCPSRVQAPGLHGEAVTSVS